MPDRALPVLISKDNQPNLPRGAALGRHAVDHARPCHCLPEIFRINSRERG